MTESPLSVDELIHRVRAAPTPLAEATRAAILERILAQPAAAPAVVPPLVPLGDEAGPRRRRFVVGASVALAAAAGLAVWRGVVPAGPTGPRTIAAPAGARDVAPGVSGAGVSARGPGPRGGWWPVVASAALESRRVSGERNLVPDEATLTQMADAGVQRLVTPVRVCVDAAGAVVVAEVQRPTGYPAYDAVLVRGVSGWRFRALEVDGRAVPVCAVIQFVFRLR